MAFIFRVIVALFVGRKFLQLAATQRKDPSRFALLGGGVYFLTAVITANIIEVTLGPRPEGWLILTDVAPTPVGLLAAWIAYNILKNPGKDRRPSRKATTQKTGSAIWPTSTIHPVKTESDRRNEGNRYNKSER